MAVKSMRERFDWLKTGLAIDDLPLAVGHDLGLEVVVILVVEVVGAAEADLPAPQRAGHVLDHEPRIIPGPNQSLQKGNLDREVIPKSSLIRAPVPGLQANRNLN